MRTIIIAGVGGVGSHLAYMIAKHSYKEKIADRIILVDNDKVELKNLQRQFFFETDLDQFKVIALNEALKWVNHNLIVTPFIGTIQEYCNNQQIDYDNTICCCATDDLESKKFIAERFKRYIIGSCDRDIIEITTDAKEFNSAWEFGTGYSVIQDIAVNTIVAGLMLKVLLKILQNPAKINIKLNLNDLV